MLFDLINPIVVDRDYNGWFIGGIPPSSLPRRSSLTENDSEQVGDEIAVSYQRDVQTTSVDRQTPPTDSCAWPETRERIHQHFAPTRQNVRFYLMTDEGG